MKYPRFLCFTLHMLRYLLVFLVVATLLIAQLVSAQVVEIPDPNLERAFREALELPQDALITQQEMSQITNLEAGESNITDLSGLEHATSLNRINLSDNQISNLRPLAGLISLVRLRLNRNQIVDISPLANLTNITNLGLTTNQIVDISPLANLTNLRDLGLSGNQIHNLTPLAGLIHLESIGLNHNQVVDISPLANLTNLKYLHLSGNQRIVDINPLTNLTQLMILKLADNSIENLTPLANLILLEELGLERNAITDITPLIGLKSLQRLRLAENSIYDFSPLLKLEGVELDLEIDLSKLDELNLAVEIPDLNLERAIRDTLSLPETALLTRLQMQNLTRLSAADSGITDLAGLTHASSLRVARLSGNQIQDLRPLAGLIHLETLALEGNPISDLSPLANLTNLKNLHLSGKRWISDISPLVNLTQLERLNLSGQAVFDITPLSNLTNLVYLSLEKNYITNYSSLANLVNLRELWINQNTGIDFTPLQGLNLTEFRYDEVCEIPPFLPSVRERIESRSFPSIFQSWSGVVGLDHLTQEQRNVLHDLHWSPTFEHIIQWDVTPSEPAYGVATNLAGTLANAHEVRQRRLNQNSNMVFLFDIRLRNHLSEEAFPSDSDFWFRDADGQILQNRGNEYLINFLKTEVQELLIKRTIAVERCGLYDGVFFDGFLNHGAGFDASHVYPATDEEVIQAWLNIFRQIRQQVREDFLIIINANDSKPTRYAEFINGTFMEAGKDQPGGYSRARLQRLEGVLSWAEENLREPRTNCLQGAGMSIEPPDGPNNLRWMRLFTALSLTHSDGYVLYTTGFRDLGEDYPGHDHLWHDFWAANLGQPVSEKQQLYQNIPGLFVREFTNGWAVYNRSGRAQTITLPASATPVSDRGNAAASLTHLLPDLDGEIYLSTKSFADVNGDGRINVLDLVQVANGFGKASPDPNGDGVVNVLDLVFITQQFSQ